jgi:hypothetical protein
MRRSYLAKGIISAVLVAMAIAFSVMLARKDRSGLNVGGEFPINLTYFSH